MSGGPSRWLRSLVGAPPRPATRMTEAEALATGRAAAAGAGLADELEMMDLRPIDGRLCWVLGTATRDAGWTVIVDDATGEAGTPEHSSGWTRR